MKTPCCNPSCGERRLHYEDQDTPRGHQMVEAPEGACPVFCSFTCAISDGWMSVNYEDAETEKARQVRWRAKHELRQKPT